MALGNGVWRLLDPLGVVGTGMGGISVWGRGGGGRGGAGRSGMFRKTFAQAHSGILLYVGTTVFFLFFLKQKESST